ncbi:MAG: RND transporter, partial [Gammaproteobacteria bacterium]|nr:RND transporter [Gammaproteobacteria bacterium]
MDFQVADRQRKRRNRRLVFAAAGTVTLAVLLIGLGRIVPASPEVNRSVVWTGVVERGEFVRQVRGPGSLQVPPEQVRWLA